MKSIIKLVIMSFFISLFFVASFFSFIVRFPIKHVTKQIQTVKENQKSVDEKTTVIYCNYKYSNEAVKWIVVGKDGILFNDVDNNEELILVGNTPKYLNATMASGYNTFIFKGKYLGEKVFENCGESNKYIKVFEVHKWNLQYPIKRNSSEDGYPLDGLCLMDIIMQEKLPIYTIEDDKIVEKNN